MIKTNVNKKSKIEIKILLYYIRFNVSILFLQFWAFLKIIFWGIIFVPKVIWRGISSKKKEKILEVKMLEVEKNQVHFIYITFIVNSLAPSENTLPK